jgi:aspartyl aminopeptidase
MDAPRLDLKQNPLYEDKDTQMAILRTHYYGGIKKYQWVANPLALVGTVVLHDGKAVDISIGLGEDEPVFMAPDLLPHLGHKEQAERKSQETIRGEELQIVVGNMPINDKKVKEKIKIRVLEFLNKKYGMIEEDFLSAEIEAVPVGKARDVGLDRSMIGAYGQDDRICSYTSMEAIFGIKEPERTAIALFVDKEEIGSDSNTGIKSKFLYNFVTEILERSEEGCGCETMLVMSRCKALSADVNAGVEPNFKQVHEMSNASKIGFGVVMTKFTGSGGKYTANDANAEFVGEMRVLFNKHKVSWQTGELGKVDEGGGGTVAKFLAEYAMDVIDCGPALLSMHSTFEVSSKADVYAAYEAYKAFFLN